MMRMHCDKGKEECIIVADSSGNDWGLIDTIDAIIFRGRMEDAVELVRESRWSYSNMRLYWMEYSSVCKYTERLRCVKVWSHDDVESALYEKTDWDEEILRDKIRELDSKREEK
jgi:hypothetical protein